MASVKGKLNLSSRNGVGTFRVYQDNERGKVDASSIKSVGERLPHSRRISIPVNKGSLLTTGNSSKGSSRIMGKIKGKHDNSVNQNIRRKALSDVSNVCSSLVKNVAYDGSKPRISVAPGSRTVNLSSKKPSTGKIRNNLNQSVGDFHIVRKVGVKDSYNRKTDTKNPGHESVVNNSRKNAGNSFAFTRKSLPVVKNVNKAETSKTKENDEGSQRPTILAKPKVNKKVVAEVSIGRDHVWRNRVSDGIMAPKYQTNMVANLSSRKSIMPMARSMIKASNAHMTSRSKGTSHMRKCTSVAAISSKKKVEATVSSLLTNIPCVDSYLNAQGKLSSASKSKLSADKSDVIARQKSDRRKSYTSLLLARSKLLEEDGKDVDVEKLPSIDDNGNELEVSEYVDEIYQYYWVSEAHSSSLENFMSFQTEITPQMRGILINWLTEVHLKFELMPETLYLMVTLLDQYLSQVHVKKNEMQLIGLTALLLASKYEDFWHPRIKDLLSISVESYTRDQMLVMEKLILKKLKFRLNMPTPYVFMLRFLKAAQSNQKLEHLAFYLIELCLVEYEALKFKPSMLCASAVYVARLTLQIAPTWTPLLAKHTHYEIPQIRDSAEMILRFQKAARTRRLKVTYEKYLRADLSSVAALKPFDNLPI